MHGSLERARSVFIPLASRLATLVVVVVFECRHSQELVRVTFEQCERAKQTTNGPRTLSRVRSFRATHTKASPFENFSPCFLSFADARAPSGWQLPPPRHDSAACGRPQVRCGRPLMLSTFSIGKDCVRLRAKKLLTALERTFRRAGSRAETFAQSRAGDHLWPPALASACPRRDWARKSRESEAARTQN